MHSYHYKTLPLAFAEIWTPNRARNPERILRNAEDYTIPPHRVELVKRLPLYSFPLVWNNLTVDKPIRIQHLFMKTVKETLLAKM